jgi:hypothetical protein
VEHKLKTWPQYFEAIQNGQKFFEMRKADRDFNPGDWLVLEEYIPERNAYTGRSVWVQVMTVWKDLPDLPPGFCIMDIEAIYTQGDPRRPGQ